MVYSELLAKQNVTKPVPTSAQETGQLRRLSCNAYGVFTTLYHGVVFSLVPTSAQGTGIKKIRENFGHKKNPAEAGQGLP